MYHKIGKEVIILTNLVSIDGNPFHRPFLIFLEHVGSSIFFSHSFFS